jgi:hypothetical protein
MKKLKSKFNSAKFFAVAGFLFWSIETIYFLIKYGWHYEAINKAEKTCDQISSILLIIAIMYFYWCIFIVINSIIHNKEIK